MKKIIEVIRNNDRFFVSAHVNLEGDALGSVMAMYLLLKKLKKKVVAFNNDPTPIAYSFLPFVRVIKNDLPESKYDAAMVLDCSDSFRAGKVKDHLQKARYIVNIDHHISNTFFGDVNWVDPKASSACEMVFRICKELGVMDKNIATCLYTGIFTDTGNFTYANTSRRVHRIISELVKYEIRPDKIYNSLHSFCDISDLHFMGSIFSQLKIDANKKIAWAVIKRWPDKGYDLTEVIFSMMRYLRGVDVFVLFKKMGKNKVRVNFRSRYKVDVNRVARFFGGGGHKRASGATMDGTLQKVEREVITFIKRYSNGKSKT